MPPIGSERTHQMGFGGLCSAKEPGVLIPASRVIELDTPKQAAVSGWGLDVDRNASRRCVLLGLHLLIARCEITVGARYPCRFSESEMKIKSAVFEVSAPDLKSCPKSPLPEFAFIGRSNVGKSSLINMLCERRDLAKVSVTPGKTKLINFFLINGRWSLVDLPGYGYAKVGQRDRDEFNKAVADYLSQRTNIMRVLVLIDSRLPPQRIDLEFISWLGSCSVAFALIFTKTDKLSAAQLAANVAAFKQKLSDEWDDFPEIFTCSAKTRQGRTEILQYIDQTLQETNRV